MATHNPSIEALKVACEVCLKEVPQSEAVVPEAEDYVVYFCGVDCYRTWRRRREPTGKPDAASTAGDESQGTDASAAGRATSR